VLLLLLLLLLEVFAAVVIRLPRTGVLDRDWRGDGSLNLDFALLVGVVFLIGGGPRSFR